MWLREKQYTYYTYNYYTVWYEAVVSKVIVGFKLDGPILNICQKKCVSVNMVLTGGSKQ